MAQKSSLLPAEVYEVTAIKKSQAPEGWELKVIEWGGRKYLPTDD